MYERFLENPKLTAGAVLRHILKRENMTQRTLAELSGILPQRINDIINDKRKISAEASIEIERALGIEIKGYFYKLQCNHDIFLALVEKTVEEKPNLQHLKKSIFWDVDLDKLDWETNVKFVVQRVFEYGDDEAIQEIIRFYTPEVVSSQLKSIKTLRLYPRRKHTMQKYGL